MVGMACVAIGPGPAEFGTPWVCGPVAELSAALSLVGDTCLDSSEEWPEAPF